MSRLADARNDYTMWVGKAGCQLLHCRRCMHRLIPIAVLKESYVRVSFAGCGREIELYDIVITRTLTMGRSPKQAVWATTQ